MTDNTILIVEDDKSLGQALADTLDMPVQIFKTKESTSLGAAIFAADGSGFYSGIEEAAEQMVEIEKVCQPDPENVEVYKQAHKNWTAIHKKISGS